MRQTMRFPIVALFVATWVGITAPLSADAIGADGLSPADRTVLIGAAVKLRQAILSVNPKTVMSFISSSDGLVCTDTQYKRAQIRKYLFNANSIMYQSLFDAARYSRRCGSGYPREYPATSDKAFFESAPDGSVEIEAVKGSYATVKFVSPKAGFYPRVYSFKKEGTNWVLINGLIIGRCTCG